jgi:spore germination protein (amino acid permease)
MDKEKNEQLTASQLTACLIGFVLEEGVLILPRILVEKANQDAWISVIISLIYPLCSLLIACNIAKKHPKDNVLNISREYFGKYFGNVLNVIFGLQFFIYIGTVIADFEIAARTFIVAFLTPLKVIIFCIILTAYAASKGLKVYGKMSEVVNVIIIPVMLLTLLVFKEGSLGNFKPIFETGLLNIIKASKDALYFYIGFEGLVLIHPSVRRGVNIKKAALKAFAFCSIIWVWAVVSTIIYLGPDLIKKSLWPFALVYTSVNFPIINNLRYLFMFIWFLVTFRLLNGYFLLAYTVINDLVKVKISRTYFVILPLLGLYSFIATNNLIRDKIVDITSLFYVIFNIMFLSVIMIMPKLKKSGMSR